MQDLEECGDGNCVCVCVCTDMYVCICWIGLADMLGNVLETQIQDFSKVSL